MRLPAISIWQPYASLIATEEKRYETRSWPTRVRGPIVIHAAKSTQSLISARLPLHAEALARHGLTMANLPLGAGLCLADLVDCVPVSSIVNMISPRERAFGDFAPGRFAWDLRNIRPFPEPIPAQGAQKVWLWDIPLPLLAPPIPPEPTFRRPFVVSFRDVRNHWSDKLRCFDNPHYVYIGRDNWTYHLPASKWGNPFQIGIDGSRAQVVDWYRDRHILKNADLLSAIPGLRGKTLVCWCKPSQCHGDVLAELAALPDAELERLIAAARPPVIAPAPPIPQAEQMRLL